MIFITTAKRLSVFSPTTNSFIAEFIDGSFETKDEAVIAELKRQGYESVEEPAVEKPEKK